MVMWLMLWFTGSAWAQQEMCSGPYTDEAWDEHMQAADDAYRAFDLQGARAILTGIHSSLRCLEHVGDPGRFSKLSWQLGLAFFFEQDDDAMQRWSWSQQWAWEELPWPSDFDEHPFRVAAREAESPDLSGVEGAGFVVPKKGAVFAHGKFLAAPMAPVEVPLFVQVTDKKGTVVEQYWQHGAAFEEELVGDGLAALEVPKWYAPDPASLGYDDAPMFSLDEGPEDEEPEVCLLYTSDAADE